ncbi:phosphomannomutase [Pseudoalteromonas sp. ASV78]|uniref:phosphomannomutase n=1 Tax=Pseudoalteromonas sp. ASV78 TaxID=3397851 RepID=UPI0039FC7F7F
MLANQVIAQSGVSFGTSGARGLVKDFSADVCAAFTVAFLDAVKAGSSFNRLAIAIDNRPSSYLMAQACAAVLKQFDIEAVYYGVIPTPALAYKAMQDGMPAIMVTGSHIPFDRNGLKFYRPDGEISKDDELAIVSSPANFTSIESMLAPLNIDNSATEAYIKRYSNLFSVDALKGKKIGIYEHSSAGRDIYKQLFELLGAEVTSLERTDTFVPIDTEAVSAADQQKALDWSSLYGFDAIFSTDGDGDRPLIADEKGNWLRGDVLGLLCSQLLQVEALAIPVSCNTAIEESSSFKSVTRTKIGSPYVIAEFERLAECNASVAGFEANGGYLLATDMEVGNGTLKALPTRDALLPAFAVLTQKSAVSELVAQLPARYTASDRLQNFSRDKSDKLIHTLTADPLALFALLGYSAVASVNTIDGLRVTFTNGDIIHLRPSGNAPELRCYVESDKQLSAVNIVNKVLQLIFVF